MSNPYWKRAVAFLTVALLATLFQTSAALADVNAPIALTCADGTLANEVDAFATVTMPFAVDIGDGGLDDTITIHENGLITFDFEIPGYNKFFDLADLSAGDNELIAPLYANASQGANGSVTYGADTYQGRDAFCVNWTALEPFTDEAGIILDPIPTNSFQVVIVERGDRNAGDFDIIVNYEQVQWDDSYCPGGIGIGIGVDEEIDVQQQNTCCNDFGGEVPCCDIEFEEECGPFVDRRSVFPEFDAAAALAGVSFPASSFDSGRTVDFAGSGIIDGMIDPGGLSSTTLNSLQAGRHVVEIESGFTAELGSVEGTVTDEAAAALDGALVSMCTTTNPADCAFTRTNAAGEYQIAGVPLGDYEITARAPIGVNLFDNSTVVSVIFVSFPSSVDPIVLSGPQPPAPNVTFGPTQNWGNDTTVYWNNDLDLAVTGCVGGTASWTLVASEGPSPLGGSLVEEPAGTYSGTIPALFPTHGNATLSTTIDCPDPDADEVTDFTLYIDPAGTVREVHSGEAIDAATVVLERRGVGEIEFTQVPDGSDIMDPSNRVNPFVTGAAGLFSWNVIPGQYRVTTSKAGCDAIALPAGWATAVLTDVAQLDGQVDGLDLPAASVTPVLQVNPEWLDLELFLDCNNVPTIEQPAALALEAGAGSGDLTAPATDDLDPGDTPTVSNDAPATFALGDTTVTWTVTDGEASASTTQVVTVTDTLPPTVNVPADIEATSADGNAVVVDFDVTATDAFEGPVAASCAPASGSTFDVGATTVTCDASDSSGNPGTASFLVTVIDGFVPDTTPPVLSLPTDINVQAADAAGAIVTFEATAFDNEEGASVAVTCTPESGSLFAVGTTPVNCSASDASANTADGSFSVTVTETPEPSGDIRDSIATIAEALEDTDGFSRGDRWRAKRARWYLNYADHDRYWRDDNQVSDRHGARALYFMRIAVSYMGRIDDADVAALTQDLLDDMRQLATSKIDEAIGHPGRQDLIDAAETRIDIGDQRRVDDRYGSAGNNYRQAWINARRAIKVAA